MKKIFASTFIIVTFVLYGVIHSRTIIALPPTTTSSSGASATNNPSNNSQEGSSTSTASSPTSSSSQYKDGSYTGTAANAYWGNIQVQATISNGKLTDVKFLQYPNDRGKSVEINQYADPILRVEAISVQSANVDVVSGASDTSEAFKQSLASALQQAAN